MGGGDGAERRRRAEPDRTGQELRLADRVERRQLFGPAHPRPAEPSRSRRARAVVEPVDLARRNDRIYRRDVPAISRQFADRRAVGTGADSRRTATAAMRRSRKTSGTWARASAMSRKHPTGRSGCSRMAARARRASCCGWPSNSRRQRVSISRGRSGSSSARRRSVWRDRLAKPRLRHWRRGCRGG